MKQIYPMPEPRSLEQALHVQLFSVRQAMNEDACATLERLKSMGFAGVEPFFFDFQEKDLAVLEPIAQSGMDVPSIYSAMPTNENIAAIVDIATSLGAKRIVSGLSQEDCASAAAVRDGCGRLNAAADLLAEHDLTLCVHNHWWEVQRIDGQLVLDLMAEELKPAICFEVDLWWVMKGGADPVDILQRLGKRAAILHLKDGSLDDGSMCALGNGDVDWDALFDAMATRELIVEIDHCEGDMLEALEKSVTFMKDFWSRADLTQQRLKQRVADGEPLLAPYVALRQDRDEVRAMYRKTDCDLAFVDLQHAPMTDYDLAEFCEWSNRQGVPVLLRIRSPHEAHMIGRYCDFGASAIIVPMVEMLDTVETAVEAFYYPGKGKRSWGPSPACQANRFDGFAYKDWWNENGVLVLQFESVTAVRACRQLCLPGVDMVTFGGADLALSLQDTPDSEWDTVEACIQHVVDELADQPVRVVATKMPFGKM